jgi:hypothetical protein
MALARSVAGKVTPRLAARIGARPADGSDAAPDRHEQGSLISPASHIRRCVYRRVTAVAGRRRELPTYEVDCLHPVYDAPVRLGDLPAAYDACAACTLPGRFRPDEE